MSLAKEIKRVEKLIKIQKKLSMNRGTGGQSYRE
jgi:hypothetical protein